jgi:hypothetical protein
VTRSTREFAMKWPFNSLKYLIIAWNNEAHLLT